MQISEIPEFFQQRDIISLSPESNVGEAVKLIEQHNIGALPITASDDPKKLVGVFSERDIIKRVFAKGLAPADISILEVMTPNPDFVSPDCEVGKAIDLMVTKKYRHMPVVENDKLVGFLSQRDFMALSWMELLKYKATHGGDSA